MVVESAAATSDCTAATVPHRAPKQLTFGFAGNLTVSTILEEDLASRSGHNDNAAQEDSPGHDWHSILTPSVTGDRTVKFLRETHAAISPPSSHATRSALQAAVAQSTDFLLPQRELAASRMAVKDEFTRDILITTHGLFSMLVFRLITFNTDALRNTPPSTRRVVFHSLADWELYCAAIEKVHGQQGPDFYCNRRAVGKQTQVDRVVENAPAYWEAANNASWPLFFAEKTPTFEDCFRAISQLRWINPNTNKKVVPPLLQGTLSRYLICTDFAYAGAVAHPTTSELSKFIHLLNSGAMSGLRILGYCRQETVKEIVEPTDKSGKVLDQKTKKSRKVKAPPIDEVEKGFGLFYAHVSERLTDQEKGEMGWTVLMADHTLCKVTRLHNFWRQL